MPRRASWILTALDTGGTVNIQVLAQGVEESAALGLVKPPGGALVSALLDIGGFRHTSLTSVPSMMHQQPFFSNTTGIDYAELNPTWLVRVGTGFRDGQSGIGFSTNGGQNWFQGNPPGSPSGGSVAASANGERFVWAPEGSAVLATQGFGNSFTQASGIPAGAKVASDRVDPMTFYGYANGSFYRSTNGGTSFSTTVSNLPSEGFVSVKAVPGQQNNVWVAGETGLFRSTNGGTSFTALPNISWAYNVGFGAPAPGQSHPAVYAVATIGGVTGVFRSDNAGSTWVRINDNNHQWGNMGGALTGDPDIYGRVYLGTNGRGILYGDRTGAPPTTPPVTTTPPAGTCAVSYHIVGQWQGGFQGDVTITNTSSSPVNGWTLAWSFPAGQQISQLWNGSWSQSGSNVTVGNVSWNAVIAANGGSVGFGFLGNWQGSNPPPAAVTLNGTSCTMS